MADTPTAPTPARPKELTAREEAGKRHAAFITARKGALANLLGDSGLNAETVVATALAYVAATPALWPCDPESVYDAIVMAAKRNLLVGPEGYAWLVPYKERNKDGTIKRVVCQYQLGYKGALQLMRRSGAYTSIEAFVVYQNEVKQGRIQAQRGTSGFFRYDPILFGARGPVVGYVVFAKLATGEFDFETMDVADVEAIKARSASAADGPWVTDFDRMALKTIIKRFAQRAEMSAEDRRSLVEDDEKERRAEPIDVTPTSRTERALPSVETSGAIRADSMADRVREAVGAVAAAPVEQKPAPVEPPPADEPAPVRAPVEAPAAKVAKAPAETSESALLKDLVADAEDAEGIARAEAALRAAEGRLDGYDFGQVHTALQRQKKRLGLK